MADSYLPDRAVRYACACRNHFPIIRVIQDETMLLSVKEVRLMKKLIRSVLITVWLGICLTAGARAENDLTEIRCGEWRFSTKIPAGWNASPVSFDDPERDDFLGGGFILTSDEQELPQVWIVRRDHFFNVGLYLDDYFYSYMGSYGIGRFEAEDSRSYQLGGRTLYGASAIFYDDHDEEACRELRLIPVSNNCGTEFVARYTAQDEETVLSLLDTVIRYYQTDAEPEREEAKILPASQSSPEPDLQDSGYLLRVEDADKIETEGYFTAALYATDHYSEADVRAMRPGDTILIQDLVLTIDDIDPKGVNDDGSWYEVDLIAVEHAIQNEYYSFTLEQTDDGYVAYFGNDNHSASRVGEVRIPVPSSNKVPYYNVWEYEETLYTDDLLGSIKEDPAMFGFGWTEYNHSCQFKDGHLIRVDTWDYPYGPDDPFMP